MNHRKLFLGLTVLVALGAGQEYFFGPVSWQLLLLQAGFFILAPIVISFDPVLRPGPEDKRPKGTWSTPMSLFVFFILDVVAFAALFAGTALVKYRVAS